MPLITVLAGSQGWECGISLNNQDCRIKTRRQEQRGHTAAICAAAVVGGSGRGGCAGGAMPIARVAGRPPPPQNRPCAATAVLKAGVRALGFTSQLSAGTFPVALASPRRGGRLQIVIFRKWLLKNRSGSLGAWSCTSTLRTEELNGVCGCGFGMGASVRQYQ